MDGGGWGVGGEAGSGTYVCARPTAALSPGPVVHQPLLQDHVVVEGQDEESGEVE